MEELKKLTNEELISEFKSLSYMVDEAQCFGSSDVRMLMCVEDEIVRRGGSIQSVRTIKFD